VRLWNIDSGLPIGMPLTGHIGGVSAMALGTLEDGRPLLVACAGDGTVRVWEPRRGETLDVLEIGTPIRGVAVAPGGHIVLGGIMGLLVLQL
jgi:WD40 repeat protein